MTKFVMRNDGENRRSAPPWGYRLAFIVLAIDMLHSVIAACQDRTLEGAWAVIVAIALVVIAYMASERSSASYLSSRRRLQGGLPPDAQQHAPEQGKHSAFGQGDQQDAVPGSSNL